MSVFAFSFAETGFVFLDQGGMPFGVFAAHSVVDQFVSGCITDLFNCGAKVLKCDSTDLCSGSMSGVEGYGPAGEAVFRKDGGKMFEVGSKRAGGVSGRCYAFGSCDGKQAFDDSFISEISLDDLL